MPLLLIQYCCQITICEKCTIFKILCKW